MRSKSTALMEDIINYIDKEYLKNGRTPTMQEIADEMNITKGCVSNYIKEMTNKGLIINNGGSRGIVTNKMQKSKTGIQELPVVGSVACGKPLLAEENIELYIPVSNEFLGKGKHFILKATGNSMINAGINDGDYVIVRQQESAEEGQIVVALIDDEATLKRYYIDREKQKIRLHPENNRMKDMFYDNIIIQGVAIKVIKDLV